MLPIEFTERMKMLLGQDEYEEFAGSFDNDDERVRALRVNGLKTDNYRPSDDVVLWEENGYYYDNSLTPGKHPYHEAGLYYIQEPSAMAPVHFLDPQPGDRVLDLCAAPGGKSTQIASRLKGQGLLITNEINRDRCRILSLNIERMGVPNAMVLNEDSSHLADVFEGYFDKILVDAPCSGEGMFRKNEEAFSEWSPENVRMCAGRQNEILDNASRMLLPGGRLVYSTCTFSVEENEDTIFRFLLTHSDFHVDEAELIGGMEHGRVNWVRQMHPELADSADEKEQNALNEVAGSIRLWPHKVRGEGHFLCVLRRDGSSEASGNHNYVPGGRFIRAKKDMTASFEQFLSETFESGCQYSVDHKKGSMTMLLKSGRHMDGAFMPFGDQLYLADENMPSTTGLKVLRCGLHLGTVKKDRFEPSHALALFLMDSDVKLHCDFASDSSEIKQFLNGQSIRGKDLSDKKGWCLITTDKYSIGWAKLSGGMLKNHYPKGLRINY